MNDREAKRLATFSHPEDAARPPYPGLYAVILPRLVEVARAMGYALAVHGSMWRDLDLIACPWVEEAAAPEDLAEAIRNRVGGSIHRDIENFDCATAEDIRLTFLDQAASPHRRRPHGRMGFVIHMGGGPYIDLSVMPRQPAPQPTRASGE